MCTWPVEPLLIRTPITANQISVAILALGFWAACLFSRGTYAARALGAAGSLITAFLLLLRQPRPVGTISCMAVGLCHTCRYA